MELVLHQDNPTVHAHTVRDLSDYLHTKNLPGKTRQSAALDVELE